MKRASTDGAKCKETARRCSEVAANNKLMALGRPTALKFSLTIFSTQQYKQILILDKILLKNIRSAKGNIYGFYKINK